MGGHFFLFFVFCYCYILGGLVGEVGWVKEMVCRRMVDMLMVSWRVLPSIWGTWETIGLLCMCIRVQAYLLDCN